MKIKAWLTRDNDGEVELWFDNEPVLKHEVWFGSDYIRLGYSDIEYCSKEALEIELEIPVERLVNIDFQKYQKR